MTLRVTAAIAFAAALLFTGCSSEAPKSVEKAKEPEKPAEPVSGRYAFHQMYVNARIWSADVQGLQMKSIRLDQLPKAPLGKAAAWQATFVSQNKQQSKTFTYSIVEAEGNLHKGVFAGLDESWTGPRGQQRPWPIQALKVDSDAAYETALKKGAAYSKKNPDKPISFLLELTPRHPNLAWRVIWGDSVATSNFSIYVDASTGDYLETMR